MPAATVTSSTQSTTGQSHTHTSVSDDFLLASLVESNFVTGSIKTVFERGKQDTFERTLNEFIDHQRASIQRLCSDHYGEFLGSVSQLKSVRQESLQLRGKIVELNDEIQAAGRRALDSGQQLVRYRRIGQNIQQQLQLLEQCRYVSRLATKATVQIRQRKYYAALITLAQLEKSIRHVQQLKFAQYLSKMIPRFRGTVKQSVEREFNEWLVLVRRRSFDIGLEMLRQERRDNVQLRHISSSSSSSNSGGGGDGDDGASSSGSRSRRRSGDGNAVNEPGASDDSDVFEKLHISFTPVYTCRHIYQTLNCFDDFKSYYKHNREIQLRNEIKNPPKSQNVAEYEKWLCQIMGFFAVEHAVLNTTSQLLSSVEVQQRWETTMVRIIAHLERYFFEPIDIEAMGMVNVSSPRDGDSEKPIPELTVGDEALLEMKHIIASFCFCMSNQLDFYVTPVWGLLEGYRIRFAQLLLEKCKRKVLQLLEDGNMTSQQFEVHTIKEWNKLKRYNLVDEEQAKKQRPQFPVTMAFSPLVIALCEVVVHDLMDPFFAFARNLFSFDLSSPAMMSTDKKNSSEQQQHQYTELRFLVDHLLVFINDQFERQITSAPSNFLSQYAQSSVNALILCRLCEGFFEEYYQEQKRNQFLHLQHLQAQQVRLHQSSNADDVESLSKSSATPQRKYNDEPAVRRSELKSQPKPRQTQQHWYARITSRAHKSFEQTRQRADDMILRAIMNKIDEMLMLTETVDWANETGTGSVPHGFISDMVQFLDASNFVLRFLEQSKREYVIFKSCEHIARRMMEHLCEQNTVYEININSMRIVQKDIQTVEKFGLSVTSKCKYSFAELACIVDFIVGEGRIEALFERLIGEVQEQPHLYLLDDQYKQSWAHELEGKVKEFEKWVVAREGSGQKHDNEDRFEVQNVRSLSGKLEKILHKIMNRYVVLLMREHTHLMKKAEQIQASLVASGSGGGSGSGTPSSSTEPSKRRMFGRIFGRKNK